MRNKVAKSLLTSMLALMLVAPAAGCGSTQQGSGNSTLLYVANYGGGIGRKWLDEANAFGW